MSNIHNFLLPDKGLMGMDFDWITRNLYAASEEAYILVCKTKSIPAARCAKIKTGQTDPHDDAALSPERG